MKKILFIVFDGLGDKGKAPLEVAEKPSIDHLAKNGICGLMDNGLREGSMEYSEAAGFHILGYKSFPGRGYIEALGAGVVPRNKDICFRSNFATVDPNMIVLDRRAGRSEFGLDKLAKELDNMKIKDCKIIFKKSKGHRAVLIIRGTELSPEVSGIDPMEVGKEVAKSKSSAKGREKPRAVRTAKILNEFTERSHEILLRHPINKQRRIPANIVLSRFPGRKQYMEPFKERYGLDAACVAAVGDVIGLCKVIGMDTIQVGNGHVNTDMKAKLRETFKALRKNDFVFLHLKGTDEAAHDKDFEAKKNYIERADREVIKPLLYKRNLLIVITGDHITSVYSGEHEVGLVPILVYGAEKDNVEKFDENSAKHGDLGLIKGLDLMEKLLSLR
jgi:2,3-bisphosphoglycerate-independent phosphoglycerate mutase